jgi:plasmid rolling circle replication initiator protein Rep
MCNWRRARKYAIENYKLLKCIQQEKSVRYIFATFTIKNPLVSELKAYVKFFNQAWQRMTQTKKWRNSILGYIKAIEIPFQKSDKNYINLHAHCLLIVPSVYFDKKYDLYITQQEYREMWRKALRADYNPSVDIRIIKSNNRNEDDEIASVVAETTKYPLKSIDLHGIDWRLFKELTQQVKNMRFLSFGGIAKDYRYKLFNTLDFSDKDLIFSEYNEIDLSVWEKIARLWYSLDAKKYRLVNIERCET